MTAGGTGDERINLEGLTGPYTFMDDGSESEWMGAVRKMKE